MLVDIEKEMKRLEKLGIPSDACELVVLSPDFIETRYMILSKEVHTLQIKDSVYFFDGDNYSKF